VALTKARQLGFKVAACASTGNLGQFGGRARCSGRHESVVLIPHDLEKAKVTMTTIYGGTVIAVEGTYDDVNRLCAELTSERPSWAFVNVNVRTYYAEGSKTLAFEVAEQLGWRAPDHVVVPIGSGSQLTKVAKGFAELASRASRRGAHVRVSGLRPRVALRWPRRSLRGATPSDPSSQDHREVARHRQPGRWLVRPADDA